MERIANSAKSKKGATKKFNKISSMLELLERNLEESVMKEKQLEEIKMLSEVKEPLLYLENCSLHELISILQKFAK